MRLEMLVTSRNAHRNPRWSKFNLLFKWAIHIETLDDHRGFRFAFQWPLRVSIFSLFVWLFLEIKPGKLRLLCWEGSKPPGGDHTRAEAQTTCEPKIAAHTTYLSIYGEHSTSWRAGSHPWTYTSPIQNASSNERRPPMPCLTYWFLSFFLSQAWVSKTQPNHWTKQLASTRLAT